MRKLGRLELCLVLPDGSKSLVPADWTDIGAAAEDMSGPQTLGSLTDLLHARAVVDGLVHRAGAANAQDTDQPNEEVPRATAPAAVRADWSTTDGLGATRPRPAGRGRRSPVPADGPSRLSTNKPRRTGGSSR